MIVVGISPGVKQNVFSDMPTTIIIPRDEEQLSAYEECCAKIKPGYEDEFHACFSKEYKRLGLAEKAVSFCYEMSGLKRGSMFEVVSGVAMRAIPTAFLLLFAFIGTFGLFWLNSKKRKVEFALRLVVGDHILEIRIDNARTRKLLSDTEEQLAEVRPEEAFAMFFSEMNGREMTPEERELMRQVIAQEMEGDE